MLGVVTSYFPLGHWNSCFWSPARA